MALLNNPYIIDIIIGLFLIIYTFIGYLKGFIIRLYDFFSLFIAYFLTINFSFPLSTFAPKPKMYLLLFFY